MLLRKFLMHHYEILEILETFEIYQTKLKIDWCKFLKHKEKWEEKIKKWKLKK